MPQLGCKRAARVLLPPQGHCADWAGLSLASPGPNLLQGLETHPYPMVTAPLPTAAPLTIYRHLILCSACEAGVILTSSCSSAFISESVVLLVCKMMKRENLFTVGIVSAREEHLCL